MDGRLAFTSHVAWRDARIRTCVLTEIHRQTDPDDARLQRALRVCESIAHLPEEVYQRWLAISTEALFDENAVKYYPVLVPTHRQAQRINDAGLRNLDGASFTLNATDGMHGVVVRSVGVPLGGVA